MITVRIEGSPDTIQFPDETDESTIQSVMKDYVDRAGQSRASSAGSAVMQGGGVGVGKSMSGFARLADLVGAAFAGMDPTGTGLAIPDMQQAQESEAESVRREQRPPDQREAEIAADPVYQAGQEIAAGAQEAFPTNPRFSGELFADVLPSSLGQMVPTVAGSLLNPALGVAQYGLSAGQSGAEEAIASGRPDQAQKAFALNAPIGALSEALLGSATGIRLLRDLAKSRGIVPAVVRGAVREGSQEGLEQVGGNVVAGQLYDPKRGVFEGVPTAVGAGLLLGGAFGGAAGLSTRGPDVTDLGPSADAPPGPVIADPDLNELPADLSGDATQMVVPGVAPVVESQTIPLDEATPTEVEAATAPQQPGTAPDQAGQDVPVPEAVVPPAEGAVPAVAEMSPNPVSGTSTEPAADAVGVAAAAMPADPSIAEPAGAPGAIWDFGQRALAKLDAMDTAIRSNTYNDPFLLTTMARYAIAATRLLVRGGMALDQAIRQAVAQARQQFPAEPDNDDDLIESMMRGLNTRQFVDQMDSDPSIGDDLRSRMTNVLYVRQPNEDSAAFAGRVLDQVGPDQGMLVFRDTGNGLDGASRTMLGLLITRRLATAETTARQAGRLQEADAISQQAGAFVDEDFLPYSTDIAQALQAFSAFRFLTPAATIDWARRRIERSARRVRQESGHGTDAVADRMQAVTGETLEPVTTTPEVQGAAGRAVDDAVEAEANSPSGPVADAMRMEASNNIDMLPSMRRARTDARVRALQNVARASGYWQTIVNTSSRQLERRLDGLLRGSGPRVNGETVASLATSLTEVLGQQLDAVIGRGVTPATRTRPDHLLRMRQLLSNSERMSQIWRQVREAIAADPQFANDPRIGAVLNSTFDVWSAPLLRRVIDQSLEAQDISIRELVRRNYQLRQGALGERLATELGLDPELAQRLATAADGAYLEAMNRVRSTIPQRTQRIRRTPTLIRALRTGLVEGLPVTEVDRALADAISRHRVNLGRLVRRHYRQVDAQGRQLAEVLVQEARVSGPVADQLANAVRTQFAAAADQRRQQELQRIIASGTPANRPVRQAWERLVEMSNLGAINSEAAWNAIQDRMDLPRWTPTLAADVRRLADDIQTAPDGIPQQRAVQALLDRLARANMRWWDLPIAFWYANVLSGPVTQARNVVGNVTQVMANTLVSLRRPQDWPAQMAALGRGMGLGARDAVDIFRTGRVTGPRFERAEAARALELVNLPGRLDYMLTPWRMVGRALAATDTLFFRGASEQRAELLARMMARSEGLRGRALATRVAEILGRSDVARAEAQRVALAEGLSGNDLVRRVADITERSRPQGIRDNARQYGLRATFNQEPYGVMGFAARAINQFSNNVPAFRFIVPFTNVVANVVNEGLSWFPPTAIGRSLWGHFRGELEGRPITSDEDLYDQHARAALGLVLLSGIFAAAAAYKDDEDPAFAVTSLGPHDSGRRAQLRQRGWIPHSVKLGDRYYSYANTPIAIPMAWIGNWFDGLKYNRFSERDLVDRLAYAVSNTGQVILDQSFLDGLARFLGGLQKDDPKASGRMLEGFARSATSIVVPNALRQIDRMFDPTVYDSPTMEAAMINSIPFARRTGQPALNVWGQPVQIGTSDAFASAAKEDPVLAALARQKLWISTPSSKMLVDNLPLTSEEIHVYTAARGPRLHALLSMPGVLATLETVDSSSAGRLLKRAQAAADVSGDTAVRQYRSRRN
jgi:hypothetical protein